MAVRKKKKKKERQEVVGVYQQAIAFAADSFRGGDSELKIAGVIKETFKQLTDANVQLVLHKASQQIADQFARDRKNIVALHVKRYNQEIERLLNKKYDDLIGEDEEGGMDAAKARKMRIDALWMLLDVMMQKERVLQLHNKDTQIKIFNKLNAKIKEKKVMFNLSGLTLQEKIDFLSLVQKSKKTNNELFSIKLNDTQQQITEEAQFEVLENRNIDKIQKTNEYPAPVKVKTITTAEDITKKLQAALHKKALKEIEKKGGNKGGPYIKDLTDVQN